MILLTSWIQPGVSAAAREAGISACLPKPVRTQRLLESLRGVLGATVQPRHATRVGAAGEDSSTTLGRILAAEDNIVNKTVIARLLQKANYQVDVVDNGVQAVEAVARARYDAVLMDCQMAVMDGFEAAAAIRAAESGTGRRVPIIALTASAMAADREQCLAAGMDAFLTKPIKPHELVELLKHWVPRRPAGAAGSAVSAALKR